MNKATSILGALNAGKQPSQKQISAWIDWFLNSELIQVEQATSGGELTESGKKLASDLRVLLEAYKSYGEHKNGDNQIQETFWHLNQADLESASLDVDVPMDKSQASRDYRAVVSSLRTSLEVLWSSTSVEGSGVFADFASFARLSLADAAEALGEQAERAADGLRAVESEVQEGERDMIGRKRKSDEQEVEDADARMKFEKAMDSAKVAGSTVIGVGQDAKLKAEDFSHRSNARLRVMCQKIANRAQNDSQYRDSLNAIFDLIEKWTKLSGDIAADAVQATSLESFINDPTPDQHLIKALHCIRRLAENVSGGKDLDDFFSALRQCVLDIRQDPDLQKWSNDFMAYVKKNLVTVGQAPPEELRKERQDLKDRWARLTVESSSIGRQWKEDFDHLRRELRAFQDRIDKDRDLSAVRKAHAQLTDDLQNTAFNALVTSAQTSMDFSSWFWQDIFNVYLPRFLSKVLSIPIPRTEYKDSKAEFVLEDFDISSFNLLPGNVFVRNITDLAVSVPKEGTSSSSIGSLTQIQVKALQLSLRELSFYYYDKSAAVGPSEFTGLAEVTLPPQGVSVDIKIRMIPSTPEGLKQREEIGGYHRIERIIVQIDEDIQVRVTQSNHAVLLSVFQPIFRNRLRETLETVLSEQIRSALVALDSIAYDVARRSEVFADAGLSRGPALTAAMWSELGRLRRMEGGLFSGWHATGTGIVKDAPFGEAQFAMGAEPQVLSSEKRGPKGSLSQSSDVQLDIRTVQHAKGVASQAKETVRKGVEKAKSFRRMVELRKAEEEKRSGWSSPAFNV